MKELDLLAAHNEEVLVRSLEQGDAKGQIHGHGPELHIAREVAIEIVRREDHEEIDMEGQDSCKRKRDVSHLH